MILVPILLMGGGIATLYVLLTQDADGPVPDHQPDIPAPPPGSTGYRLVDAILDELRKAATASGIPLGLIVGWIAKESGGKLAETTKLDERGYFQLMPAESESLGLDHQRLSTDEVYSINAGLLLIAKYMKAVQALGIAPVGSSFFWKLVKLAHTMGAGAMNQIVAMARNAGAVSSWDTLENYAVDNDADILHATKHSPKKWFPLVDAVFQVGAPFGFGTDTKPTVVGAGDDLPYTDIPDPIDCLPKGI